MISLLQTFLRNGSWILKYFCHGLWRTHWNTRLATCGTWEKKENNEKYQSGNVMRRNDLQEERQGDRRYQISSFFAFQNLVRFLQYNLTQVHRHSSSLCCHIRKTTLQTIKKIWLRGKSSSHIAAQQKNSLKNRTKNIRSINQNTFKSLQQIFSEDFCIHYNTQVKLSDAKSLK